MALALSKFATRKNIAGAATLSLILLLLRRSRKNSRSTRKPGSQEVQYLVGEKSGKKESAHVDGEFFRQLRQLLRISIPGVFTPETGYLVLVAASLVARSLCDLWMIQNGTLIESAVIGMDRTLFWKRLFKFFAAMPIISLVNNVLKYGIGALKLRLRIRLTRNLYDQYLCGFTYYKMSNLDTRIANADQLLTTDVEKFCDSVTDLYSNVLKPLLDILIYVYRLTANIGAQTPFLMILYLMASGVFLTHLRRPTGRMTMKEQKLEGEFRHINSRLIASAEEVAFYQGNRREKITLLASFQKLIDHLKKFLEFRFAMGFVDNIIAKYIATVVGFWAVSIPFLSESHQLLANVNHHERLQKIACAGGTPATRAGLVELSPIAILMVRESAQVQDIQFYYTSGRMLVKLAEAIGRLVLAGREMTRLAGFTSRVTMLRKVLIDLNQGNYQRTMVTRGSGTALSQSPSLETCTEEAASSSMKMSQFPLIPGSGRVLFQDNIIKFDRVPLVTPNGDILVPELSFEVRSGMNVLVCGPNGCGKSSLFRVLGELWPLFGGTLTKPPRGKLFYIPQRPYMTLGTLRDQVIYPHTRDEMASRGITDAILAEHLDRVRLGYLLSREGGWDAVADWIDVLSGGEKQRIAMARLFYHAPQFAILDECTSAVSVDVEGLMYQYCREVDITLFTVSHRRSLWKHHEYYLQMDGRGSFDFKPIEPDTVEFGS